MRGASDSDSRSGPAGELPVFSSLDSAEQAQAWRRGRQATEVGGASLSGQLEQLDAQMTWWLVHGVFARHPELTGFSFTQAQSDDTEGQAGVLVLLRVLAMGRERADRNRLAQAEEALLGVFRGYGLLQTGDFFDMLATGGCTREGLDTWDWGCFGAQWRARRVSVRLAQALGEGRAGTAPRRL